MDIHCRNCNSTFAVESLNERREVLCPNCATAMIVAPKKRYRRNHDGTERGIQKSFRLLFDPIPRLFVYVAGAVLVTLLLSPFLAYLWQGKYQSNPVTLSEDTANMVPPSKVVTAAPLPSLGEVPTIPTSQLEQFRGLRLNSPREDLQDRFNLILQNTREMRPEIYESTHTREFQKIIAHFYGQLLKEFWVICGEKKATVDIAQEELATLFGSPQHVVNPVVSDLAVAPLGVTAVEAFSRNDPLTKKLAGYPFRRDLIWADVSNRVEATIYYSSRDPAFCLSTITLHISAAEWLKSNPSSLTTTPAPVISQPGLTITTPVKLFP